MNRRTSDILMAILALGMLMIFLGILLYRVPRLDLTCIVGATLLLVIYDFFISPTGVRRSRTGRPAG